MRGHKALLAVPVALLAAVTLYACGGNDEDSGSPASTTVSAYVTDDLGGYDSVELTLRSVQLRHTSGRSCEIIGALPVTDFAELGRDEILELVNTTNCPVGPYNRLYVELDRSVKLKETTASTELSCEFVSYFEGNLLTPNQLACANGTCSLNITGAVNLVAGNHEHVALDVDLKNFVVDTSVDPCQVTLKVSPLHADEKLTAGFRKRISGTVSDLIPVDDRFVLTGAGHTFTVQYSGVTDTDQPGLETLLERAAMDGLRTSVRCQSIDMATSPPTCTAQTDATHPLKAIAVKAEGTISELQDMVAPQTFTLNYGAGTMLPVNYAKALELLKVKGTLANDAVAEATLYGYDGSVFFLAREVEVK